MSKRIRITPEGAGPLTAQDVKALRNCCDLMFHLSDLSRVPDAPDYSDMRDARTCKLTLRQKIARKKQDGGWVDRDSERGMGERVMEYGIPVNCTASSYSSSRGDYDIGTYETMPALNMNGAFFSADYLGQKPDWDLFKSSLRAGDILETEIVGDNNNHYVSNSDLHVDEAYLVLLRPQRNGNIKRYRWLAHYSVTAHNSARILQGFYETGWKRQQSTTTLRAVS